MISLKKIFLISVFSLINQHNIGFSATLSTQTLSLTLPQVLEIEKIIVENVEYHRDEPMPNMVIKETNYINDDNNSLTLSPMKVQIHTNVNTPIIVQAQFKELNHKQGLYNFSQENLTIVPKSQTISEPYDHVITDIFIPYVNVKPQSVLGLYRGVIYFTIGAI